MYTTSSSGWPSSLVGGWRDDIMTRRRSKSGNILVFWTIISGVLISVGSFCISKRSSKRLRPLAVFSTGRQEEACMPAHTNSNVVKIYILKSSMGNWFFLFSYDVYIPRQYSRHQISHINKRFQLDDYYLVIPTILFLLTSL